METLDEFNKRRSAEVIAANTYPQPNGIACPECGGELQDLYPMLLQSYPPKRNVGCPKCDYRGYRIA